MKIAMPYSEGKVNPHFGSSREFIVFDTQDDKIIGSKILTSEKLHNHSGIAEMLKSEGVEVVITGGGGRPMANALQEIGFKVITGISGEVKKVAGDYLTGQLIAGPVSCSCSSGSSNHCHSHNS